MPKVHFVKKAQKDYPEFGIERGSSYWWWKFPYRPKMKSLTYPKPAQLTTSSFLQTLYAIEEAVATTDFVDWEDVQNIIDQIEDLRQECEDSLDNMPDHLRDTSESGEMLQERIDSLEGWANELLSIESEWEDLSDDEKIERVSSTSSGL